MPPRRTEQPSDLPRRLALAETLAEALASAPTRAEAARRAAEAIRHAGGYRWVGLYDVGATEIGVLAWAGPEAPAHPRFPRARGITGVVAATCAPVVVQDVARDPRYLTTIGGTRAEMIVPVLGADGAVVGTIDVESAELDAFDPGDVAFVRAAVEALRGLWAWAPA
jgi:GAF domain-containing protein